MRVIGVMKLGGMRVRGMVELGIRDEHWSTASHVWTL